ncbi:up-regulator of cell proliferation-like [Chelonia mydas]|uniref:up-regulator of cell proliferation-like n=1 Tax=Chelonia mydas TaxID=8469 RepID=UPI001CA8A61B|nr:up-regulator of cell proliferation-like [Chelonia mydas]
MRRVFIYSLELKVSLANGLNHGQESQTPPAAELGEKAGVNQEQKQETQRAPEPGEKDGLNLEQESVTQKDSEPREKESPTVKRKTLLEVLSNLNLDQHRDSKLKLRNVLEISLESTENSTPKSLTDLPGHFLRKVMALNVMARNTNLVQNADEENDDNEKDLDMTEDFLSQNETDTTDSLNPLDVFWNLVPTPGLTPLYSE